MDARRLPEIEEAHEFVEFVVKAQLGRRRVDIKWPCDKAAVEGVNHEREIAENLLHSRINILLVFASLVMASASVLVVDNKSNERPLLLGLLGFGVVIAALITYGPYMTYSQWRIASEYLSKIEHHATRLTGRARALNPGMRLPLFGLFVPLLICLGLALTFIVVLFMAPKP